MNPNAILKIDINRALENLPEFIKRKAENTYVHGEAENCAFAVTRVYASGTVPSISYPADHKRDSKDIWAEL